MAVNCAAIVETLLEAELFGIEERTATGVRGRRGKFEHAHDGTLFLDEVSDLSGAAQAKLLSAIKDLSIERVGGCGARRVDTRIIVASNRPLSSMVERGSFRLDLYYRLHGVGVQVPPLRDRREDVPELAQYFLERHRLVRPLRLSVAAIDALLAYRWPGPRRSPKLDHFCSRKMDHIENSVGARQHGNRACTTPASIRPSGESGPPSAGVPHSP